MGSQQLYVLGYLELGNQILNNYCNSQVLMYHLCDMIPFASLQPLSKQLSSDFLQKGLVL
jgi:hypothetical protein